MIKTVEQMTAKEAYAAYAQAQEVEREQRVVKELVANHYKPLALANGGKVVVYQDEAGVSHGFKINEREGRVSVRSLRKVLADAGLSVETVNGIINKATGDPSQGLGIF